MQRRQVLQLVTALPVASSRERRSLLNAPAPKFQLWDEVYHDYLIDDDFNLKHNGKTFRLFGVVIGMVYNLDGCWKTGWTYYVVYEEPVSLVEVWEPIWLHESEMKLTSTLPIASQTARFGKYELLPGR